MRLVPGKHYTSVEERKSAVMCGWGDFFLTTLRTEELLQTKGCILLPIHKQVSS